VVDANGRKMSKSLGNVIAPQKVCDTLGAEIIRLWVASADFSGELALSDEILKRVVESYRRIRNTLRFLLSNTADFDPARDSVPVAEWPEIDRYALAMTREMAMACMLDYAKFDFYLVAQRLQTFCSEDLGGFYLDILKDRLYTSAAKSAGRRSAQGALALVTQMLLRLMAPMLSFTAEEAWAVLNPPRAGEPPESVFFHTWKDVLPAQANEKPLLARWKRIREIRAEVMKRLEARRETRDIGSSLQERLAIGASGEDWTLLDSLGKDLKYVMITSSARLARSEGELTIDVAPSADPKCERCWHYRSDVGRDAAHPTICGRCVDSLAGREEERRHA